MVPLPSTIRWLSTRVKITCAVILVIGSLLPPYVPHAALAPQEDSMATPQFLLVEEGFIMKSASLTRQGSRRAYAEGIIHSVKEGESIERLASRYSITPETIRWANKLEAGHTIQPGEELLVLPVDGVLHTVSGGQNLTIISELYGVSTQEIAQQNDIKGGFILAGQELIIPGGKPIVGKPITIASAEPPPAQPATKPNDPPSAQPTTPPKKDVPEPPKDQPQYTSEPTPGVLQKPCSAECFITQYFHSTHFAIDMQEKGGGPIYAAEAGTVIRADYGWSGGYGNVIEVDHGNELITLYAHNKELYVKEGDLVERGQLISWMGNTGLVYGKTGIHVHFEVQLKGMKKNPLLYIQ